MQTDLRLFGLDLNRPWTQARDAGRQLLASLAHALSPAPRVHIIPATRPAGAVASAPSKPISRYRAVELPESILLRRCLRLPALSRERLQAALTLDIQTHSPFPPEQAVWVSHSRPLPDQRIQLDWALTTRALIDQHLKSLQSLPATRSNALEVWVPFEHGQHQPVAGYGEGPRLRHIRRGLLFNSLLLLIALGLTAAIAITPTAQWWLQAKQAEAALHQLQLKSAPILKQRERLLQMQEQAEQLHAQLSGSVAALHVLASLSQALPDDTALRTLYLQGSTVRMSGQTANAAQLMKQLGQQPGITNVRAPNPATRPPGATKEQFDIELQQQRAQPASEQPVPATPTTRPTMPPNTAAARAVGNKPPTPDTRQP